MVQKGTAVCGRFTVHRREIVGFSRFMGNGSFGTEELIGGLTLQCRSRSEGRRVLAIEDTTMMDFSGHKGIVANSGIGPIGDNKGRGFYLHPVYVLDQETRFPLGFGDVKIWNRAMDMEPRKMRKTKPVETKESYRWIESAIKTKQNLPEAKEIIFLMDREGDIYEGLARIPDERCRIIVRAKHSRRLSHEGQFLMDHINALPTQGKYILEVPAGPQRSKRRAKMEVKFSTVQIIKPHYPRTSDPKSVAVQVVEAREHGQTVPKGEEPIHWVLLTTCPVGNLSQARQAIEWYNCRWEIETLFRTLKSKGLCMEDSQLRSGEGLKKLSLFALDAAAKITQLTKARDGSIPLPASVIFRQEEIKVLEGILPRLEGKTEKQKNHFDRHSIAWAAWIIARLGGWKGYKSDSPPGNTTMKRGLERFEWVVEGANLEP